MWTHYKGPFQGLQKGQCQGRASCQRWPCIPHYCSEIVSKVFFLEGPTSGLSSLSASPKITLCTCWFILILLHASVSLELKVHKFSSYKEVANCAAHYFVVTGVPKYWQVNHSRTFPCRVDSAFSTSSATTASIKVQVHLAVLLRNSSSEDSK